MVWVMAERKDNKQLPSNRELLRMSEILKKR
jgi:hypothetical protein